MKSSEWNEFVNDVAYFREHDRPAYFSIVCMCMKCIHKNRHLPNIPDDILYASKGDLKRAIKCMREIESDSPQRLSNSIEETISFIREWLIPKLFNGGTTHE